MKTIGLYRGKEIESMTREELVDALIQMGNLYSKTLKDNLDYKGFKPRL